MKINYAGLSPYQRTLVLSMKRHAPEPYRATRINWPWLFLLAIIFYAGFFGWLAYQLGGWVRGILQ